MPTKPTARKAATSATVPTASSRARTAPVKRNRGIAYLPYRATTVKPSLRSVKRRRSSLAEAGGEAKHPEHVPVELPAPRQWHERADRPGRVGGPRDQQEVGSRPRRADSPGFRVAADDVQGVRDRHAIEAEAAQEPVRRRLENGPAPAQRRVDAVADHHAGHVGLDGRAVGREVGVAEAAEHMEPVVRGDGQRPETGKVLHARARTARGEPARERDAVERRAELARSERSVGKIENRPEIYIDADAAQRATR